MRGLDSDLLNPWKRNIKALFICFLGVAVNLILHSIVSFFELPLYLDTIGTVVVSALGGYLPGVIVGIITNTVTFFNNPVYIYFGFINVAIAVLAARMGKEGWFRKPIGILASIVVFTFVAGGVGNLVPWFVESVGYENQPLADLLFRHTFLNEEMAMFVSGIIADIPDKAISVFISVAVMYMLPAGIIPYFSFIGWSQSPVVANEISKIHELFSTKKSIKNKLIAVLGISLSIVAVVSIIISLAVYRKTIIDEHSRIAQGIAEIIAGAVDGDKVDGYLSGNAVSDDYYKTKVFLSGILNSSTDVEYVYVIKPKDNGFQVIYDIDAAGATTYKLGDFDSYTPIMNLVRDKLLAGKKIRPVLYWADDTQVLTAYEPVFNSKGECVCYAAADINMDILHTRIKSFIVEMVSIFLGFFIVIMVIVSWLADQNVIIPIKSITKYIEEFSYAGNSQKIIDRDVKKIRSIDVHTGDEIEKLYNSISKLTSEQAEQIRNIKRLNESTSAMQEGLLITMADMVENFDSDTGAHIQKTAAYVKIILEGLKKKGYYPEKVTPRFISDCVRSAPLHDVGKVSVSDTILNKPGKFEPWEYEIMKSHTTAGRIIIEKAIASVNGANYLKEARNMAGYHHERWDGTGYPEGLHGEAIPLSARIMAVADVFDALTSPRVYKPAFPLDKALQMIQEGAGTQFDPKCVEVFMESLAEVKVVLKKYNPDL